jgi:hypothetical protein
MLGHDIPLALDNCSTNCPLPCTWGRSNVAVYRRSSTLDYLTYRIHKHFGSIRQHGYFLCTILCDRGTTSTGVHRVTYPAPPALMARCPLSKMVIRL